MSNIFEKFKEDTTVNYTTWAGEQNKEFKKLVPVYLANVIDSFMLAPVALHKDQPIQAVSRTFKNIRQFVEEMEERGSKIVLYQIDVLQSEPTFNVSYDDGGDIVNCEYKGMSEPTWIIRGAWL